MVLALLLKPPGVFFLLERVRKCRSVLEISFIKFQYSDWLADLARPERLLHSDGGADIVQFLQTQQIIFVILSLHSLHSPSTYWSKARKISVAEVMISR